ncbi:6133_t:CDS:10, partial [Funneliformis mosseae]
MSSSWYAYFDKTQPKNYRFLGFYEYRSKQVDFTFSFRTESYKLQMDLYCLINNGTEEMKKIASQLNNIFKRALIATMISECCLPYGQNVCYGKLEPCTTTVISECYLPYSQNACCYIFTNRDNFLDVNAFWNKIELNKQLQNQLQTAGIVEATSSLISISTKTFVTAIRNVHSAIENVNDILKITGAENTNKRPAEEPFPVITPPPNLCDRSSSLCYNNEESTEASTEASSKTNDHNESNIEITRKEDDNPFKAKTVEDSTKYKSYAINNVIINNVSKNDITQDGYNISIDFRNFQLKCLSSIMYCNELKPEYVECSEKTWNKARPRSLAPKMMPTVAHLVIIEYNTLLNERPSLNTRANGESESSKERRLLDDHNHSRKLDFQIITKIDDTDRELIFGEIKPLHYTKTINKSIIKLAEFMKGSLD